MTVPEPVTMTLYCALRVLVTDPSAVTAKAVQELRDADIDWSQERDDLASAVAELGADLPASLMSLAEPDRMFEGVAGVTVRGARVWVEPGIPRAEFGPGWPAPDPTGGD